MSLKYTPDLRHHSSSQHGHRPPSVHRSENEWRCQGCDKLLGIGNGEQMHIRRKPAEYLVGYPITAKCPGCGALNVKTND